MESLCGNAVSPRSDIQSVWCGHRPLISQTSEGKDTAGVVRSHTVLVDDSSGLVTLLGGKWTTYRKMAEVRITKSWANILFCTQRVYLSQRICISSFLMGLL